MTMFFQLKEVSTLAHDHDDDSLCCHVPEYVLVLSSGPQTCGMCIILIYRGQFSVSTANIGVYSNDPGNAGLPLPISYIAKF